MSKDCPGKFINSQFLLNQAKKFPHTDVNHVENLNDHPGKPVNAQLQLKFSKKPVQTVLILLISKDHSGKSVSAHPLLKEAKK